MASKIYAFLGIGHLSCYPSRLKLCRAARSNFEIGLDWSCIYLKERHIFKVGKLWLFKQFFDNKEIFKALRDYYSQDNYRFEFKTTGERNNALKILERNGFDYDLVEDIQGYVVRLPGSPSMRRS